MRKRFNVVGIHKTTKKEIVIESHMTESQAMVMCEQWGWTYDDGTNDGSYWMEIREEKREMENKQAILNAICDALRLTDNAGKGNALKEIRYMVDEDGNEYAVPIFETGAGEPDEYYPHGYYGVNITADSGTAMFKDVVNCFVNVVW